MLLVTVVCQLTEHSRSNYFIEVYMTMHVFLNFTQPFIMFLFVFVNLFGDADLGARFDCVHSRCCS